VFIAQRPQEDRFGGKWEFPGGKLEFSVRQGRNVIIYSVSYDHIIPLRATEYLAILIGIYIANHFDI
jgi:hypothetical protein